MTKKRFTSQRTDDYNFSDILDNGKWVGICHVDCEDDFVNKFNELAEENKELKASLYAEKTNTAEVVNDYAKQFKRHSAQFSFMMDLAEDLGVDIKKLEALDD